MERHHPGCTSSSHSKLLLVLRAHESRWSRTLLERGLDEWGLDVVELARDFLVPMAVRGEIRSDGGLGLGSELLKHSVRFVGF